jgi:hypothetical protein
MSRGVDVDAICVSPPLEPDELGPAAGEILSAAGFAPLASIDEVLLDTMLEWCKPGERCIAATEPFESKTGAPWQILYDTQFSHAAFAEALSKAFPDRLIVQFNLQEEVDLTLRVLQRDAALYEFSNAPGFFNWGRCIAQKEIPGLARVDIAAFIESLGRPVNAAASAHCFQTITAKTLGERTRPKGKHTGGAYDAMQALAAEMGLPRLYRFFEGWMKSDLDWDEDNVAQVWAFRKS